MNDVWLRITGITIMAVFYGIYAVKMVLQRKKGIQTDQMAKKKEKNKVFYVEAIMKTASILIVAAEIASMIFVGEKLPTFLIIIGIALGAIGDIIFGIAVYTMKDSWRAGIPEKDKTEMVADGIYKISRNPAFLGFDCIYIGILLMFFNIPLLIFTVFSVLMFHLQILNEEKFLTKTFGAKYVDYRKKVCRYLGRKF